MVVGFDMVGGESMMQLTGCTSHCDRHGCWASSGRNLTAHEVVVSESRWNRFILVHVREQAVLMECTATKCGEHGLCAQGAAVDAEGCIFQQNGGCDVLANKYVAMAVVVMKGCRSSQHKAEGYSAMYGARLKSVNSFSDGDKEGCGVSEGGNMTMEKLTVDGVCQSGTLS